MSEYDQYDDQFDDPDFGQKYRQPGMSGCAKVAVGCGALSVVGVILALVAVWWVAANAREIGAEVAAAGMKEGLKELQLPAEQQQRISDRIDDVAERFKKKEITNEEVAAIFRNISQGPLIPAGMALVVQRAYLDESGLEDDEKSAAQETIQRFTHGAIRKQIPQPKIDAVLDTISDRTNKRGERKFRHPISDGELRVFIEAARQAADDANVPQEVPIVNFADEFDKAIDRALDEKAGQGAE